MCFLTVEPTATIAGGIIMGGQTWTVNHNQLTGNTEGKRVKCEAAIQELVDSRTNVNDLPADDPEKPGHPDNAALGYTEYTDPAGIAERAFYWKDGPRTWLIHRTHLITIVLVQAGDPTLGGNDRYSINQVRLSG